MRIRILNIDYHRNGVGGAPFHAIVFRDRSTEGSTKLGIVFEAESHVAVLDIAKLAGGDIAFGSNSWRGDHYEKRLREAIEQHDREIEAELTGKKGARS